MLKVHNKVPAALPQVDRPAMLAAQQ